MTETSGIDIGWERLENKVTAETKTSLSEVISEAITLLDLFLSPVKDD